MDHNKVIDEIKNKILTNNKINTRFVLSDSFKKSNLKKSILSITSFLDESSSISERIYCILNNISDPPKCICGVRLRYKGAMNVGYSKACSIKCSRLMKGEKWKSSSPTKRKAYDDFFDVVTNSPSVFLTLEEIKENCENISQYDIKQNLNIFQNILHQTNFLPTFNGKGRGNKTISWAERIYCILNNIKNLQICNCGVPLPFENKNKGYRKFCNNECRIKNELKNKEKIIQKNFKILNKGQTKLKGEVFNISCKSCGHEINRMLTNSRWKSIDCPVCMSKFGSKPQKEIYEFISCPTKKLNNRNIIELELDIYIPSKSIAIELNGNYWHSELRGKDKNYHLNKTILCKSSSIQLLHFFESEWIYQKDICKSIINSKLGNTNRIYARKCKIVSLNSKTKNSFLDKNHIQGKDRSNISIGLQYEGSLVSIMTFIKSRFNKNYEWELSRYCNSLDTTVVGGAGKLLNYFIKNYNPTSIVSYANRRYSNGNLYKQLGFGFSHYSKPNYFYFHKSNCYDLLTRHQFQKHKLKDKLEYFDSNLSEWDNMQLNGYDRIWDCGNGVWSWTK